MAIIKKILNLEINDDYIRLVFLRKSHKKVFIDKSIIKEINFDIKNDNNSIEKIKYIEDVVRFVKEEIGKSKILYKNLYFNIQIQDIVIRNVEVLNTKKKRDILSMIEFEITQYIPININNYSIKYKVINSKNDKLNIQVILFPKSIIQLIKNISENLNMNPKTININFDILQKLINLNLIENFSEEGVFIECKKSQLIINITKDKKIRETYLLSKEGKSYEFIKRLLRDFKYVYYYGIENCFIEEYFKYTDKFIEVNPLRLKDKVKVENNFDADLEDNRINYINSIGMII
ncbi:TPA: pilus assembly protein PilM [Clostridioides difficile]|uniref:pilus assembly protein PilM n=1 Tax=Clostridioides difficile TaxID=1496 RepID=UPI000C9C96B1|nr:pilus assembly protein PilM [Clostridioides difficile]MBH6946309.1 pilus assembly protein PilM [Clostridioides difficile]MBY2843133.1 pilus assembly protein PilM [Clostridioides difficile]MBZ0914204.1 pilus assembly protein PilM [Clostridioides difficile]MCL6900350.1 pilus assembly protein PilM [Clostridioides difficile]MCR8755200.1 pilus assembly protein PilM [Clostridioides difficile]